MRFVRVMVPIAVLAVAFGLRFWALDRPDTLVFDELFYVRDAITQLIFGYPTEWLNDSPAMSGAGAQAFTADASNAVHPPLGKWLIGLGILAFGPDSGWGWRSTVALAGVATVGVTMRLGFLLTRNHLVSWVAGLLLALDGVHITLSRVGLLDGFLTFFVALGALCVWHDAEQGSRRPTTSTVWWSRPWLAAAGLAFGAAAAVKWSGLYPLAFFLVWLTVRDVLRRFREGSARPLTRSAVQACATAVIALPAAACTYLASWIGWIATSGGWARDTGTNWFASLVTYHAEMLDWHGTLNAPHPYQAHPLSWPLALRPTAMHRQVWEADEGCPWERCVSGVIAVPNPLITWGGVVALIALIVLVWQAWRVQRFTGSGAAAASASHLSRLAPISSAAVFVVVGYLSGWLPWVLTFSRSAVFQFYAVVLTPFSALALAMVLGLLCRVNMGVRPAGRAPDRREDRTPIAEPDLGRRISVALFLVSAAVVTVLFFPVWSGIPVADWFWQAHMWLPTWG